MKQILYIILALLIPGKIACVTGIVDSLERAGKKITHSTEILVNVAQEKQKQLHEVEQELATLVNEEKTFEQQIKNQIEEIKAQRTITEAQLKKSPEDDFFKKKLSLLNESYQVQKDIQRTHERLVELLDGIIKLLTDFLDDPEFESYKKEKKLLESRYYAFEDLIKFHEEIIDQEKRVNQLTEQEKATVTEFEGRKRIANATHEAYKRKQEEYHEIISSSIGLDDQERVKVEQTLALLKLEEQLYVHKKVFDELRLREIKHKITYIGIQLVVVKRHLDLLKKHIEKIKPLIRVSEADVVFAKDEFEEAKQEHYAVKELYRKDMDELQSLDKKRLGVLENLSEQYGIILGRDLDEWTRDPKQIVEGYVQLFEVGNYNSMHLLLNRKQELIDAQIALEDEKNNYKNLLVQVKESYHKITIRKFLSEDELKLESNKYDIPKAEIKATIAIYKEKMSIVADYLSVQKRVLDNIRMRRDELKKQKSILFINNKDAYLKCLELLNNAEDTVREQIDILGKLTGIYSAIVSQIIRSSQLIDIIKSELAFGSIWYRTEDTIKWQEIKDIMPDILNFLSNVRAYIVNFDFRIVAQIKNSFEKVTDFIIFLIKLLILLFGLLIICRYSPVISLHLKQVATRSRGITRFLSLLLAVIFDFYSTYFVSSTLWIMLFAFLFLHKITDAYLYILFYLLSIPYLLYLADRFIRFIIQRNIQYDYAFLASDFQRRFVIICSILLYVTIVIFFFREAFILANYNQSDLPTILLAVNFIVFQISLIFLITKEQILHIIPQHNDAWLWIYEQVDRFYYLILCMVVTIIVMSNPYVGFGRLVLHVMVGLVYTMLLMIGLVWLHGIFKGIASRVFFFTDEEVVRERFVNAKTWFGLLIIASFVTICFVGFIVGVNIWGWLWDWYVGFEDVYAWLNTPILQKETSHPISVISFFEIIGFVLIGLLISHALNRYVLDKIFDLLLVDAGVQNTVTRITRYMIVVIAIFLGLQKVGLGQLVTFIMGGLVLSLGWVLKEPISDFIAYFIILVQRPVKIGDYIQIDTEVMGVVRKITPRAVVLRRKNSTTIVVPNASVINKSIVNWNYARSFIAFDDIIIIINYDADPTYVKDLLYNAVLSHPNVLRNPKPIIRLENFVEHGFQFLVRGFVSSVYTLDQWDIASDVRFTIVQVLRRENIKIAVPIRIMVTQKPTHHEQVPIKE